jgi:hypothetical protein
MMSASTPPVRLVALFVGMLAMLVATVVFAGPARAQTIGEIPVQGKVLNKNGKNVGEFVGTITPSDPFVTFKKNKGLMVEGTLNGTVTRTNDTTQTVTNEDFKTKAKAAVPKPSSIGTQQEEVCDILTLNIGAIHLDLLGLVVDLSPIDLLITAVPGEGNLLGNLLCAIAGLLDPNSALANFLNQLLGIPGVIQPPGTP